MPPKSLPFTRMAPSSGSSNPTMCLIVTVFPAPDGPSSTVIAPAGTTRSTPSRTRSEPNSLTTPWSSIAARSSQPGISTLDRGMSKLRPSLRTLEREDHLADVLPVLDEAMRVGAALEWEGLGDDRAQLPGLEPVPQGIDELVERSLRVPQPEHVEADEGLRLRHHRNRPEARHLRDGAGGLQHVAPRARGRRREAEADEPASGAQQRPAALEALPADRVHDQVKRLLLAGDPPDLVGEVAGRVVDRMVHPETADGVVLGGRGGAVDLAGAHQLRDLGGRGSHSARRRLDQHALARPERAVADQARGRR